MLGRPICSGHLPPIDPRDAQAELDQRGGGERVGEAAGALLVDDVDVAVAVSRPRWGSGMAGVVDLVEFAMAVADEAVELAAEVLVQRTSPLLSLVGMRGRAS